MVCLIILKLHVKRDKKANNIKKGSSHILSLLLHVMFVGFVHVHLTKFLTLPVISPIYLKTYYLDFFESL